jgi:hypothetical protein
LLLVDMHAGCIAVILAHALYTLLCKTWMHI